MGFRSNRLPTDRTVAAGFGARRFDGDRFHIDWNLDRVVEAIRAASHDPGRPAVADVLAVAIAKEEAKTQAMDRRRKEEEIETAHRQEEEGLMSALGAELAALIASDPDMPLFIAVEYVTPDPAHTSF